MSDERLKKAADEGRTNRVMQDRAVKSDRSVSDNDRIEMFRQQHYQSSLPDLPKIAGYHTCWLTTSNPRDSIHLRMRLGYEPIKPEDIPGWEYATLKTGDWAGFIGVNEMLAFKLPITLYEAYMTEAHHEAPMREEEKLSDTAEFLEKQARAVKSRILDRGDGSAEIGERREAIFDLNS
jgi:hypothetical protein